MGNDLELDVDAATASTRRHESPRASRENRVATVSINTGKNRPMKLWSCRIDVLEKMAQGSPPEKWSPSLRLTTKEQAAVQEANAPAMVLTQREK